MTRACGVLALLLALQVGCPDPKSEREWLVEASTRAQNGDFAGAREILDRAYAANPTSAEVLIRYAGVAIEAGELDRADAFLTTLEGMSLTGTERGRASAERRRYLEVIYDRAKGAGPAAPADPEAYERAVIGLINLERTGIILDEYNTYLLMMSRAALGGPPERSIDLGDPSNVASVATATQARASLVYLDRALDGDPRCAARRELEGAALLEAQAVRETLRLKIFGDDFDRSWEVRHRAAFEQAGRFDSATRRFLLRYDGPYRPGFDAESGAERLLHQAQTWHARERATDLAYELSGRPRADAPPLDYAVEDFATTQVSNLATRADGLAFDLAVPYETIRRGAFLFDEAQARAADPEASAE